MVITEHPNFALLQETLGTGEEVKTSLEHLLPGWSFTTIDALGRSGGLATGWNSYKVQVLDFWGLDSNLDSGLGITFFLPASKNLFSRSYLSWGGGV